MTGRGIDQVLPYSVDPVLHEPWLKDARTYVRIARESGADIPDRVPYDYVWGDALDELSWMSPDLRIVNLETAVTIQDEPWSGKGIHYRMHPGNVDVLSAAGLDVGIVANNHVLDWGRQGLDETLRTLDAAGIGAVGAGRTRAQASTPAVLLTRSGRLLLFAYGSPTAGVFPEWGATRERSGVNLLPALGPSGAERVAEEVDAHRRPGDRTVVSVHWGGNWGYEVPEAQRDFARHLVDVGGADVVFGHSSHHPKGIEVHAGRLILYGAGDFLNDYEGIEGHDEYRGELTLMYFPRLGPTGELEELVMTPMRIRHFRLRRADPEEAGWLAQTLDRESRIFDAEVVDDGGGRLRLGWR